MNEAQEYMLVSYAKVDGIRTYPDSEIRALYTRLVDEGGGHVFRDGSVRDAEGFVRMAKQPGAAFFVAYVRGELAGVVWLNRVQARFAQCNFFVFRPFWGPDARGLGRYCLRELLTMRNQDGGYMLNMLVGVTPADNRAAVAFALRCGWKRRGELPHGAFDALTGEDGPVVITTATREDLQ